MLRYASLFAFNNELTKTPMITQHEDLLARLQAHVQPVAPEDTMAEAGRKALLSDFVTMLQHETGSRTGEDVEDVHDMRVAIRRMRSTMRLLGVYYKPKAIQPYLKYLRRVGQALGTVRDLDVMISDLKAFQETLDEDRRADLQPIFAQLDG